ncbi:hypothetical protein NKI77_32965, partial [Mesorhizobium opportunistum]|uniref:hypothetical protein n=1 Tax=Mesorhizobium opportunistum TaxID=593909 RepID=UPI00335D3FBD
PWHADQPGPMPESTATNAASYTTLRDTIPTYPRTTFHLNAPHALPSCHKPPLGSQQTLCGFG